MCKKTCRIRNYLHFIHNLIAVYDYDFMSDTPMQNIGIDTIIKSPGQK